MTSTGAVTGQPRRAVLTWSKDGDDFIVAGTAGGSRTDPLWLRNLAANPHVTIERGNRVFEATATLVPEPDRTRLWDGTWTRCPGLPTTPGSPAGRPRWLASRRPRADRRGATAARQGHHAGSRTAYSRHMTDDTRTDALLYRWTDDAVARPLHPALSAPART